MAAVARGTWRPDTRPRVLRRVQADGPDGHWFWRGSITARGYGRWGGAWAHRAVYEQIVGPIPAGHELHHTCGLRSCVNPDHLQPVTRAEHKRLHPRRKGTNGHFLPAAPSDSINPGRP